MIFFGKNKQVREFIDKNTLVLYLFLIYILFHSFFEKVISENFVNCFFCYLTSSIVNDIVFIITIFLIISRCIRYLRYNYSIQSRVTLISFLLLLIIGYYRFFSAENPWSFLQIHLYENVKYIDAILLYLLSNIIVYVLHSKKQYKTEGNKGFCFDNPINKPTEDLLNREKIAKQIAKRINNTANLDSSFAIGITSEWGRGKTSFLNLIEDELKYREEGIIIHFNPWLNNDEKAIVISFFDEMSSKLRRYSRELSNDLLKYAEMLNSIDTGRFSIIHKIASSLFNKNSDLGQRFEAINNAIRFSGIQIAVFIDDLDRLYENEILEVLRLVRNSANFSNTVFIVAYDRNYLISALNNVNKYHPNFYLEKIFQTEIALPAFENAVIVSKLKKLIDPYLDKDDQIELDKILRNCKSPIVGENYFKSRLLTNLRDVNRFVNSFIISYEALKGECILLDLLNIELLRIKYLGVYNLLANKFNEFLTTEKDIAGVNYLTLLKRNDKADESKKIIVLDDFLKIKFEEVGIQTNQISEALEYVKGIFPEYKGFKGVKCQLTSINNPLGIDRYFHYDLLSSNLSEIEFSTYRQKSDTEFQLQIDKWIRKGLKYNLSRKFENIEFYNGREDYERIIRAIFHYASLTDSDNNDFWGFDSRNLFNKLKFDKIKSFYSEESEFEQFVIRLFKDQEAPYYFVSVFIQSIFENNENGLDWDFIISQDLLINQKLEYFKSYATDTKEIDKYVFWLFNYCNYKKWVSKEGTLNLKEIESKEAKEIFIKCAQRLPESFFRNIITLTKYGNPGLVKQYSILPIIRSIWNSWDNFEKFLSGFDESNVNGLKEFKNFYSQCIEGDRIKYIEFDFKEIDLSNAILFLE